MRGIPTDQPQLRDMTWISGGTFRMGSADFYPEERPVHHVSVDGFWMDTRPVTVTEFRRFVKATGYVTVAQRPLDPADYPDADPALLVPGSLVFQRTAGPVDLRDYRNWWAYVPGADWRHPGGPDTGIANRDRHPILRAAFLLQQLQLHYNLPNLNSLGYLALSRLGRRIREGTANS